jgi:WhiB family redox-sensing transcriptional regulator
MDEWRHRAVCGSDEYPTEMFFPSVGDELAVALATGVCYHACPVRSECWDYAIRNRIQDGIWGGVFLERPTRARRIRHCSRCGSRELFRWKGLIECGECSFSWAS